MVFICSGRYVVFVRVLLFLGTLVREKYKFSSVPSIVPPELLRPFPELYLCFRLRGVHCPAILAPCGLNQRRGCPPCRIQNHRRNFRRCARSPQRSTRAQAAPSSNNHPNQGMVGKDHQEIKVFLSMDKFPGKSDKKKKKKKLH